MNYKLPKIPRLSPIEDTTIYKCLHCSAIYEIYIYASTHTLTHTNKGKEVIQDTDLAKAKSEAIVGTFEKFLGEVNCS